jgi:hypothetical protein
MVASSACVLKAETLGSVVVFVELFCMVGMKIIYAKKKTESFVHMQLLSFCPYNFYAS